MVPAMSLWLPIVLSAVGVFVVSSVIHMALGYHAKDYPALPDEDGVMDALRPFNLPPGDYMMPRAGSMKAMNSPEFVDKMQRGPVGMMTIFASGPPKMAGSLVQWFVYSLLVSLFAAYVTGRALGPGADYLQVFRFAGTIAFSAYSLALLQDSIWFRRNWGTTLRYVFDGFVYGCITAGFFGWLWPAA